MPIVSELAAAEATYTQQENAEGSTAAREPVTLDVRASKLGRTHGKAWKGEKTSTRRTMMHSGLKSSYEKRREKSKEKDAIKAVEREMKEETEAERERWVQGDPADPRKRTIIRERRERQAERERLASIAEKMSAKKLQRMKKVGREGKSLTAAPWPVQEDQWMSVVCPSCCMQRVTAIQHAMIHRQQIGITNTYSHQDRHYRTRTTPPLTLRSNHHLLVVERRPE